MAYTRLAQRAQALACFVAPALLVLAYIMLAARIGLFAKGSVFNDSSLKFEHAFWGYWGFLLLIPAWFALTHVVGQKSPRLAVICAAVALFGFGAGITGAFLDFNVAVAVRDGFPMNWDFFTNTDSLNIGQTVETTQVMTGVCLRAGKIVRCGPTGPSVEQLVMGLPLVLYFLANIVLGIAILRTGALPKWSGGLLIAAILLGFDSTGPQPSGLPMLTGLLSALCLLVVYSIVGLRLWRGEAETPIMQA
jgi:hypothetical protein